MSHWKCVLEHGLTSFRAVYDLAKEHAVGMEAAHWGALDDALNHAEALQSRTFPPTPWEVRSAVARLRQQTGLALLHMGEKEEDVAQFVESWEGLIQGEEVFPKLPDHTGELLKHLAVQA
ncbi:MAG: hypothetical protein J5J00_15895 [Deltaproteobacteria bacterium]|nr:hypothetical protein [Deltaproteobacteria bacterium]